MLVLSGILLIAGFIIGGLPGIIVALIISLAMNFFAFWFSGSMALRMAHAREVTAEEDKELHRIVEEQVERARIPKPRVHVIDSDSPNAFATGRNPRHASIAVTTGIRKILNRQELGAVIAHELAHVGNRDTLIMTMVATLAMAIGLIATFAQFAMFFGGFGGGRHREGSGGPTAIIGIVGLLIVIIVLPLVATLVRLAISRSREFQADATGARTSGDPHALASALEKLEEGSHRKPMKVAEGAAHLYIVNPFGGDATHNALSGGGLSWLSTHPPMRERVRRLRDMRLGW
jgi:heat shock protein HtpX